MPRPPEDTERLRKRIARWDSLSSPEQQRRMKIWRHNGMLGHCALARANMRNIAGASSSSDCAKQLAEEIEGLLINLENELRAHRIDNEAQ